MGEEYDSLSDAEKKEVDEIADRCLNDIFGDEVKQTDDAESIPGAIRGGEGDMDMSKFEPVEVHRKRGPKPKTEKMAESSEQAKHICECAIPEQVRQQLEEDLAKIENDLGTLGARRNAIKDFLGTHK